MQFAEIELPGYLVRLKDETFTASPTQRSSENPSETPSYRPVFSPTTGGAYIPVNTIIGPESDVVYTGSSTTGPAPNIFDGTGKKVTIKTDSFSVGEPGVIITPASSATIVKGIREYTANNYKSRDPTKYIVEGRNEPGDSWNLTSHGPFNLGRRRNFKAAKITSSPNHGDPNRGHDEKMFPNDKVYGQYRVTFPETKGRDSIVAMAELELPGLIAHTGPSTVDTTSSPSPTSAPTKVATPIPSKTAMTPGPTYTTTMEPTISPSKDPTLSPVADSVPTNPDDGTPVNTIIDPESHLASVGTEAPQSVYKVCDGTTDAITFRKSKDQNPGFIAKPSHSSSIVKGIRIYTGRNYKSRDPAKYIVEGRNGTEDSWHMISERDVEMNRKRNGEGIPINSTPTQGDVNLRFKYIPFENAVAYSQYKVTFPKAANNGNKVLVAEVELPGIVF